MLTLQIDKLRLWAPLSMCLALLLPAILPVRVAAKEPTVEELKARLSDATVPDRPRLCVQISELQLRETDKLYRTGDSEKAYAALEDVVAFSELARDYSIQSHKHEKDSEIAVRKMAHKLVDLKQAVTFVDQKPIQDAIDRLQKIRDDLLAAMFPKGDKK
ncbi:MAG: hypothetical protein WCA16_07465 [Candidatus Sulfotelmatobacter sp.]